MRCSGRSTPPDGELRSARRRPSRGWGPAGRGAATKGGRAMKITANGISMNYTLDGPTGAPVVTLIHSLATTLAMWEPQLKALTARWRVLNYDTRGHGGTDPPPGAYSLDPPAPAAHAPLCAPRVPRTPPGGLPVGGLVGPTPPLQAAPPLPAPS